MGARKNIPSKKERQRRQLVAEGKLSPSHAEVRFSARRTKQVTNYNEDESDQFEASEDDMTPNYWAATVEDTGPAIDRVLNHRPLPGTGTIPPSNPAFELSSDWLVTELDPYSVMKKDFEYLVTILSLQLTASPLTRSGQMAR